MACHGVAISEAPKNSGGIRIFSIAPVNYIFLQMAVVKILQLTLALTFLWRLLEENSVIRRKKACIVLLLVVEIFLTKKKSCRLHITPVQQTIPPNKGPESRYWQRAA